MIEALKSNQRLWDLFTKKEEYKPRMLDQHQRFPYYLSRHRNVFEPEVSEFLLQKGLKVEYPGGKRFAVCLTHDIDCVYTPKFGSAAASLRKLKVGNSLKILLSGLNRRYNPLWNFRQIMNIEKKYDAKSSFYFLALEKGDPDFNFKIRDLKDELRNIIDSGWEVGLHGGHEAYDNLDQMKKEKARLENTIGEEVVGYRNHYLKFDVPKTWELLAEAGFKYDTTFGYADCVGFRNGMCHPFRPFDLDRNEHIDILEIPLTIMDRTFDTYMTLDRKKAWTITKQIIDTAKRYQGMVTILWHNHTYMVNGMSEFYEEILEYCYTKNAWMTSGEEISRWWKKNGFVR